MFRGVMDLQPYMVGPYDYRLVALGLFVAMLAAYTTLDLAGRVTAARRQRGYGWLIGGAVAIGTGFWAMHFVAMLAFALPVAMGYDFGLAAASWLMVVLATVATLHLVSRPALPTRALIVGALAMAIGIGGMRYTSMGAMRMAPGIVFDPVLVLASGVAVFIGSIVSLRIAFALRERVSWRGIALKLGAAAVMGLVLSGVHYTGMAVAHFPLDSVGGAASQLNMAWLATLVGVCTILLLGIALVASVLDRRRDAETTKLVHSLQWANSELRHLSLHDSLTDLPNRMLLHEHINRSLERWRRDQTTFAVLYIDLDNFKLINDGLGYHVGDDLLREAAASLREAVCGNDMVARLGGDEFVLVVNDLPTTDAVDKVCATLRTAIAGLREGGLGLSASIGSAVCPADGEEALRLIAAAHAAVRAAKKSGRNRHRSHEAGQDQRLSEDFVIQTDLRAAIQDQATLVHYQPIHSTSDRSLVGAEALVRWQHPEQGWIGPDRIVRTAERCGLIVELESHVLALVCAQIRAWLDAGWAVPPIAVNLSAVRLRDAQLAEQVQACLACHGLEPRNLLLEVTESFALGNMQQAIGTLARLDAMGVHIALDDFGTGHSSLAYLNQLPIHKLKIDRSFIATLGGEADDRTEIVGTIINLAHALGLRVVAEGVETEGQLACLNGLACDEVQGYLLGRPESAEVFEKRLTKVPAAPPPPAH